MHSLIRVQQDEDRVSFEAASRNKSVDQDFGGVLNCSSMYMYVRQSSKIMFAKLPQLRTHRKYRYTVQYM